MTDEKKVDGYLFARVGGPPSNWMNLEVIDVESGKVLDSVVECDAEDGWALVINAQDSKRRDVIIGEIRIQEQQR